MNKAINVLEPSYVYDYVISHTFICSEGGHFQLSIPEYEHLMSAALVPILPPLHPTNGYYCHCHHTIRSWADKAKNAPTKSGLKGVLRWWETHRSSEAAVGISERNLSGGGSCSGIHARLRASVNPFFIFALRVIDDGGDETTAHCEWARGTLRGSKRPAGSF